MIANPGFEEVKDGSPLHWRLEGGSPRQYLQKEEAHSGDYCLALRPTGSRLSWSSAPTAIKPSKKYGLSWYTRIDGTKPWHYTYLTRFTGLELEFAAKAGSPISTETRRMRCLRTDGWRKAWITFSSPQGAERLTIRFVLDSPTHIDMVMNVDDVGLEEVPPGLPPGLGRIIVQARADGGSPTPARFFVKDSSGEPRWPKYSYPFKSGLFYHLNDLCLNYLDLPPDRYTIRATKGPEFEAAEEEVALSEGEVRSLEMRLERLYPQGKNDWLSGDHHVHLFFHKHSIHPQMTIDDVTKIAKGEGLNFVSFCGEWSEFTANMGNYELARDDEFIGQVGLESVNDFYGHLCTMGWTRVPDQGIPMRCVPWPMNTDTIQTLEEMGGAWIHAHPVDRVEPGRIVEAMGNPERLSNARELPVILALGHRTNLDLLCHADPGGAKLITDEYYRLLNMGFKIGATASTDFYVDQARGTPGHNRTYVRASSLDFASIMEGYRNGRTFATNGPLVDLQINGAKVGDELYLSEGGHVLKVRLVAFSRMGLDRAKVIVNGSVHRTIQARGRWITDQFDMPVQESSWVVAHVEGPVDDDVEPWDLTPDQRNLKNQFAHTSPIYINVADRPIRPSKKDVQFLLEWLDAARRAFHSLDRLWQGYPDEPYLVSAYSMADRKRITRAFDERLSTAREALMRLAGPL